MTIHTHQKFYLVLFRINIWTVKKYYTIFFNDDDTVNTKFSFADVWFTDQASKALEIEDNVNLTLTIW